MPSCRLLFLVRIPFNLEVASGKFFASQNLLHYDCVVLYIMTLKNSYVCSSRKVLASPQFFSRFSASSMGSSLSSLFDGDFGGHNNIGRMLVDICKSRHPIVGVTIFKHQSFHS